MSKSVVGIIGSIGAGKSAAANVLVKHGGHLVNADLLGHDGLRQLDIKSAVLRRWGNSVARSDGEIDRRKLGEIVFADSEELKALQAMQFPYIGRRMREAIDIAQRESGVTFIILDAAVLLEAGWKSACDHILLIDAPREIRLDRVRHGRGWSDAELSRREASQVSLEEKRRVADAVVINDGTFIELEKRIKKVLMAWNLLSENDSV